MTKIFYPIEKLTADSDSAPSKTSKSICNSILYKILKFDYNLTLLPHHSLAWSKFDGFKDERVGTQNEGNFKQNIMPVVAARCSEFKKKNLSVEAEVGVKWNAYWKKF